MEIDDDENDDEDDDIFELEEDIAQGDFKEAREDLEDYGGFLKAERRRRDPDYALERRKALHDVVRVNMILKYSFTYKNVRNASHASAFWSTVLIRRPTRYSH
jgi:hypothetical protein